LPENWVERYNRSVHFHAPFKLSLSG
jgi:hypothetical protein